MESAFAFLDGAGPWMWLTFAVVLGVVEILTATIVLLWFAAAAAAVALLLALAPGLSGVAQMAVFATVSLLLLIFARGPVMRRLNAEGGGRPALNSRAARQVGRRARVCQAFETDAGKVEIEGVIWRARLAPDAPADAPPPAQDALVTVRAHEGPVLLVSPA